MANGNQTSIDTAQQILQQAQNPQVTAAEELRTEQEVQAISPGTDIVPGVATQTTPVDFVGEPTPTIVTGGAQTSPVVPEAKPTPDPRQMNQQERFKKLKAERTIISGPPSDEEVLRLMQIEDEELARQDQIQQAQKVEEQRELQERVARRRQLLESAAQKGITLEPDTELDPLLESEAQRQQQVEEELARRLPASEADVQRAITPSKGEVEQEAQPIRKEVAKQAAQEVVASEEQQRRQKLQESVDAALAEQDKKVGEIDPGRFWKNANTGQKILAGLAIMLGGIGAGIAGGENEALKIIMDQIDKDIDAQKLSREEALAKKEHAVKLARLQLEKFEAISADDQRKAQTRIANQKLKLEQDKFRAERQKEATLRQALSSGNLQSTAGLPKEVQDRAVRMPNGKLQFADSKAGADDVRKFQADVAPAIEASERLLKLSRQGSRFSLEDRARIAVEQKALIGQLRLPFTGPGILTETEFDRLQETIGDQNKLFALPSIERKKLETVLNKLKSDQALRFKSAGLTVPKSKREKFIEFNMKRNPKLKREEIEKATDKLIDSGRLQEDFR